MELSLRTISLTAGVALLAGCNEGKATPAPPPPPTVLVAPVEQRDVPLYLEAVGALDGFVNAEIRARVKGYLQSQSYKDGAEVKEGQPLFTIDPSEYEVAVARARAGLVRAQATQGRNATQLERSKSLASSGAINQQELDNATAASHESDAAVGVAQAELRQAEINLSYTRMRSPVAGVAGLALVRVGNLVGQEGPTLLTTVSQVDPIRVNFPLSEVDYAKHPERFKGLEGRDLAWARKRFAELAAGAPPGGDPGVELVLSDGSTYPKKGVIVAVDRQVDPSTGTIKLQALFPNPEGQLRPGQYGRVRLRREGAGDAALVVPEKALLQVQGTYSLGVVGPDNKVQLRRVEVGPNAGGVRIVTKGVGAGDRVVVEGVQKVSDGATVNPQPAPPAPPPDASGRPPAGAPSR
jgi:membrane fusion protein, multidrug efflux system